MRKRVQFYAPFYPGVEAPAKFTNGNLRRRQKEVGGGNAPCRVANRQLAQKKNIPNTHRAYHLFILLKAPIMKYYVHTKSLSNHNHWPDQLCQLKGTYYYYFLGFPGIWGVVLGLWCSHTHTNLHVQKKVCT